MLRYTCPTQRSGHGAFEKHPPLDVCKAWHSTHKTAARYVYRSSSPVIHATTQSASQQRDAGNPHHAVFAGFFATRGVQSAVLIVAFTTQQRWYVSSSLLLKVLVSWVSVLPLSLLSCGIAERAGRQLETGLAPGRPTPLCSKNHRIRCGRAPMELIAGSG